MGLLANEMEKVGLEMSPEEKKKVKDSLTHLRRKNRKSVCKKCGEEVKFQDNGKKVIPFNLDDAPHWRTCPYSSYSQRKASPSIARKMSVYFVMTQGIELGAKVGLTKKEIQVVHAMLERIFRDHEDADMQEKPSIPSGEDTGPVNGDLSFKPSPCDPVGDPDEERAPDEVLVKKVTEQISLESTIDQGVKKVITEPIPEEE